MFSDQLQTLPESFYGIFKIFYLKNFMLTYWLTDWLTDYLMPPAKHNLTMDKVTGLISSMFDIASSWDVPFCQLQYVQYMHHGFAYVLPCVTAFFADNARCWFAIVWCGFPSCETSTIWWNKEIAYTCRYTRGHLIPNSDIAINWSLGN